jgi:hypothetical protein
MRRDGRFALVWLVFAWLAGVAVPCLAAQTAVPAILVELQGQPAQPGSVLGIAVTTTTDVDGVTASAFGQTITCARDGSPRRWRGLIGIDVDATTSSSLEVFARVGGQQHLVIYGPVALEPRRFATRRLTVASRFVDPSPTELERIRLEAARLEALFRTVTLPDRLPSFAPPLAGVVASNFGTRSIFNGEPRAPHAGADYRGTAGTPIAAPGAGRVVLAEPLFFTGNTVVIDHGLGLYSLLAHLSRIDVHVGDPVERGTVVGLLGATGRVTGPHLHWGVRLGETRVDPERLLALLGPAHSSARPTAGAAEGLRPPTPVR